MTTRLLQLRSGVQRHQLRRFSRLEQSELLWIQLNGAIHVEIEKFYESWCISIIHSDHGVMSLGKMWLEKKGNDTLRRTRCYFLIWSLSLRLLSHYSPSYHTETQFREKPRYHNGAHDVHRWLRSYRSNSSMFAPVTRHPPRVTSRFSWSLLKTPTVPRYDRKHFRITRAWLSTPGWSPVAYLKTKIKNNGGIFPR